MALCLASVFFADYIKAHDKPVFEQCDNGGSGGVGNTATCYSTYDSPLFGVGGTNIFRCGVCVSVKSSGHSDPGKCNFK